MARLKIKTNPLMAWSGKESPKTFFETLELGLYDAVAHFNIGSVPVIKLLNALGITSGKYTEAGC